MAQMVKALRMILGMDIFGMKSNQQSINNSIDIEIEEDDAPKRKPSLEEIDALEVNTNMARSVNLRFNLRQY